MTAEATVSNKLAIALAADSAVTVTKERGEKIYHTVDKLFCLSEHPVGIMIYGNAEFISTPWETIIGAFKKDLGNEKYNFLEEYGNHLIKFIETNNDLVGNDQELVYLVETIYKLLYHLRYRIDEKVEEVLKTQKISLAQLMKIGEKYFQEELVKSRKFDFFPFATSLYRKKVLKLVKKKLPNIQKDAFEKFPLTKLCERIIRQLIVNLFCRDRFSSSSSGLVIAGFGEREYFPSVISYHFEGKLLSKVKYIVDDRSRIDFNTTAFVIPFAQKYMVYAFMEGIDPLLKDKIDDFINTLVTIYPETIAKKIPLDPKVDKKKVIKKLKDAGKKVFNAFDKEMKRYKKIHHSKPITGAVSVMPKNELATMAESLVQLTSLKKRFSLEPETVGGPINVAIISKTEGFVWVKKGNLVKL